MEIEIIVRHASPREIAELFGTYINDKNSVKLTPEENKQPTIEQTKQTEKLVESKPVIPVANKTESAVTEQSTTESTKESFDQETGEVFAEPNLSELDSRGLPWDPRINATTKSKKKNGEWTRLRGVDDATVLVIEEELRKKVEASKGNVSNTPALTPEQMFNAQPLNNQPFVEQMNNPVQMFNTQVPVQQQPKPAETPSIDWTTFMGVISNLFQSQKIDMNYVNNLLKRLSAEFQVTIRAITDISGDPKMIERAYGIFVEEGLIQAQAA